MRSVWITGLATAMLAGGAVDAQRADARQVVQRGPGAGYPVPGPGAGQGDYRVRPLPPRRAADLRAGRWPMRDGRWSAGWNAPGGWNSYRRPYRGWALPGYWVRPAFVVGDWAGYGLARPPYGYNWTRYYDDAVLVDARGSVYDTVEGIDWDGGERDAGRYSDDREYAPPPVAPAYAPRGGEWRSPDGTTVVTTTAGGYHGGGTTTTVVVQSTPMVTTTTTEIYEDAVTNSRAPVRKVARRRWRPTKTLCRCD